MLRKGKTRYTNHMFTTVTLWPKLIKESYKMVYWEKEKGMGYTLGTLLEVPDTSSGICVETLHFYNLTMNKVVNYNALNNK